MNKRFIFFLVIIYSHSIFAQVGLPIHHALIPKNSLVVNYDFSKSTGFTRGASTANNLAGTASGNPLVYNSPNFMNSLGFISFNGTSQYVMSPNLRTYFKSVNSTVQKSFTMSLWIYPTSLNGVIVSEHESQTLNSGYYTSNIELVNGYIKYKVWDVTPITSTLINLNQWYHIAMVYDGATLKAYLNGVSQGSRSYDRIIPPAGQFYGIGSPSNTNMGSGLYGNFYLAQFKLYQLPLSDYDILKEYELRNNELDYTIHSPSTNSNPTYWSISSAWAGETTFSQDHFTPWLNNNRLGWAAQFNDLNQWITLNYDEPAYIKGVVIQPRANSGNQFVTKVHVETSMTGAAPWTRVVSDIPITTSITDDGRVIFPTSVFAKSVKVIPVSFTNHITMRMGMLVKPNNSVSNGLILNLDPSNLKSYSGSGATFNDLTSNALNFTLVNGPTYDANGSFAFNGTNQYASIAHSSTIKPTSAITIEQWLNADDWNAGTSSNYKVSISNTQGGGYSHNIWDGVFYSYIYAGGVYRIASSSVRNFDGWQHFVTSFDGRYTKLFINGSLANTVDIGSANNTISYATNSTFLGTEAGSGTANESYYWQGKIGKTQIYNRALSDQEVQQNYNNTKIRYDGLVLNLDAGNIISYNGTGSIWNDISGNANSATLTNGPVFNSSNGGQIIFDGLNDFANGVAIPSTSGNNSRTVILWYKSTANKNTVLIDKGGITDDVAEQLFLVNTNGAGIASGSYPPTNTGGIALCFWGNDFIYPISASTLFDGNWHFIAYTYNKSNRSVNICFDGTFASTVYRWNLNAWTTLNSKPFLSPRVLNTTNNPYLIGQSRAAYWGYGGTFSNVSIPNVQIYNRALTESEILNIYNTSRSKY